MKSLDKIVETLLINGSLLETSGLFHGKTGIAIYFFHYARHTGNDLFVDYAMDLIEDVQNQINSVKYHVRYDTGLAGIGCGFEYILQNGFLEADNSDIFEDFDDRMFRATMYEPYPNFSLESGLTGWGRYFIYRISGNLHKNFKLHEALSHIAEEISKKILEHAIPETEQPDVYRFLCDLSTLPGYSFKYDNSLRLCRQWKNIFVPNLQNIFPYMSDLLRLYSCQKYFNIDLSVEIRKEWENWKDSFCYPLADMGLLSGWANDGLMYLTFINNDNVSWMNLL